MIASSYFGNKLHDSTEKSSVRFKWTLQREKLVVFSGQIFLCLNFLLILVALNAPNFGYAALFLLLIGSLWSFFKTFASKDYQFEKNSYDKISILGCDVDALKPTQVLNKIQNYLNTDKETHLFHIITADSLAFVRCNQEPDFLAILQSAEMVVPDGAGLIWAADFIGTPLPSRVPGVALVSQICEKAAKLDWKVFFVGGKPGVAQLASDKLRDSFPKLKIAGIEHGYFQKNSIDEESVIKKIIKSQPSIVFVALGVPRQEDFILKLRTSLKNCVAIGVGGSFDVIAGNIPRAPVWMQNFGIEWLFRLYKEPFRFWRILEIPRFVLQVLRYKMNQE
jgi:N-acetylglucosaminyldiphosphoundecaprenol N-acetyl-beta-D-mannosaminyltransferase